MADEDLKLPPPDQLAKVNWLLFHELTNMLAGKLFMPAQLAELYRSAAENVHDT